MRRLKTLSPPRLLLLLPQWPGDPASGAARNMYTAARMLQARGWDVHALGTTASESLKTDAFTQWARANAISEATEGRWWEFEDRSIPHRLLETGGEPPWAWQARLDDAFDAGFNRELNEFHPDVIYTFGGDERARNRWKHARSLGCTLVLALQNLSYMDRRAFEHVDEVLCCSEFLRQFYHDRIGLRGNALPTPLDPAEVIADQHQRVFVTMINPSFEKGLMFHTRLCEELGRTRPDIPVLTVGSRGTAEHLVAAGQLGGFDLRRHASLMYSTGAVHPKEIFALARILLVPSLWQEPAGRVAGEALVNGIPPIVSDRGGLPEVCGEGGFILPLPAHLTMETESPASASDVSSWTDLVQRLIDDQPFYDLACSRAQLAGETYAYDGIANRYDAHFRSLLTSLRQSR